jgi:hypothetical protein
MRDDYKCPAAVGVILLLSMLGLASSALATPDINCAILNLRIFDDCFTSTLTTNNNYPAEIWIQDDWDCTTGFANLHNWRFSTDCQNAALFMNDDAFSFSATIVISGTGNGESGLQVSPWWSQNVDGRLNIRTTDGEIACFGGRLPFFSFTGTYGVTYTKGDPIYAKITYLPHSLSMQDPATIRYEILYNANYYDSGPLPFDEGNPAEGHGSWGMLDDAQVGGHVQVFIGGAPNSLRATWTDITFVNLKEPTATENTSWGKVKGLFQ